MTRTNSPLQRLIVWADSAADDRHGRMVAASWRAQRPALAGYPSVGSVIRAGWADPNTAAVLLSELVAVSDRDGVAVEAALAILAPRLAGVVARWARAGVPAADLEDMEADLLTEAMAALRARPEPRPPTAVVDVAWARVRTARRRHRRAAARQVPLEPAAVVSQDGPVALTAAATVVVDGFRSGRLSLPAAQALWATGVAGWSGPDAARRLGCQPAALRARRSRAIRSLAA